MDLSALKGLSNIKDAEDRRKRTTVRKIFGWIILVSGIAFLIWNAVDILLGMVVLLYLGLIIFGIFGSIPIITIFFIGIIIILFILFAIGIIINVIIIKTGKNIINGVKRNFVATIIGLISFTSIAGSIISFIFSITNLDIGGILGGLVTTVIMIAISGALVFFLLYTWNTFGPDIETKTTPSTGTSSQVQSSWELMERERRARISEKSFETAKQADLMDQKDIEEYYSKRWGTEARSN